MAQEQGCTNCAWRARHDSNPGSLLGRLWRWHAGWCPGWKKYISGLPIEQRRELIRRYRLTKFQDSP